MVLLSVHGMGCLQIAMYIFIFGFGMNWRLRYLLPAGIALVLVLITSHQALRHGLEELEGGAVVKAATVLGAACIGYMTFGTALEDDEHVSFRSHGWYAAACGLLVRPARCIATHSHSLRRL